MVLPTLLILLCSSSLYLSHLPPLASLLAPLTSLSELLITVGCTGLTLSCPVRWDRSVQSWSCRSMVRPRPPSPTSCLL